MKRAGEHAAEPAQFTQVFASLRRVTEHYRTERSAKVNGDAQVTLCGCRAACGEKVGT